MRRALFLLQILENGLHADFRLYPELGPDRLVAACDGPKLTRPRPARSSLRAARRRRARQSKMLAVAATLGGSDAADLDNSDASGRALMFACSARIGSSKRVASRVTATVELRRPAPRIPADYTPPRRRFFQNVVEPALRSNRLRRVRFIVRRVAYIAR